MELEQPVLRQRRLYRVLFTVLAKLLALSYIGLLGAALAMALHAAGFGWTWCILSAALAIGIWGYRRPSIALLVLTLPLFPPKE